MAEIAYRFTDAVETALRDERARLKRCARLGIITTKQAMEMYLAFLRSHLYGARVEDNPDRPIAVKCAGCRTVQIVPASLKYFQCKCTPRMDRLTWTSRVALS